MKINTYEFEKKLYSFRQSKVQNIQNFESSFAAISRLQRFYYVNGDRILRTININININIPLLLLFKVGLWKDQISQKNILQI